MQSREEQFDSSVTRS
nr:unnamed protein product [Callosobruchus chinensis]